MEHTEFIDMNGGLTAGPATGALLLDETGLAVNAVILARPQDLELEPGQMLVTDYPEHAGIGWRRTDTRWDPPPAREAPMPYQPAQADLWP